jgi:hypothetical protein
VPEPEGSLLVESATNTVGPPLGAAFPATIVGEPPAARFLNGRLVRAVVVALELAGLAAAANLVLTKNSPLVTTDSASYLSAAHNLTSGKGLTTAFNDSTSVYHPVQAVGFSGRVPFAHFEPLYAILIAGLHLAGMSYLSAARAIGATSIVLIVLLLSALAYRTLKGYLPVVVVFVVITVVGPSGLGFVSGNLLELSGQVLSEPLFYVFTLAALLAGALFLEKGATRYLVATALLVVAATLTRYVGFSVAIAISLAILLSRPPASRHRIQRAPFAFSSRQRMQSAALVFGAGVFALVGWPALDGLLSGGSTPRQVGFHIHPHLLGDLLSTAGAWFFPTDWPSWLTESGALLLLAAAAIVPFAGNYFGLIRRASGPPPQALSVLRLAAIFMVSYLVVIVGSSTVLDASLSLDQRVLGPMQVMAYLLLVSLLYWAVRSRVPAGRPIILLAVPAAIVLLLVLPNVVLAYRQLGRPYPSAQPTPAMAALARLPRHDLIFTNEPSGVFIYAHRGSVLAPVRKYPINTDSNLNFKADVEYVGNELRIRRGVVALLPDIQAPLLSAGELQQWAGLVVTRRFADGTIFLSAPPR